MKKGVYVDSHNRADVVAYHTECLAKITANEHLRAEFDNETLELILPTLRDGEKRHVSVHHDESIFRSNEQRQRVWVKDGNMLLRKKGQGKPFMFPTSLPKRRVD